MAATNAAAETDAPSPPSLTPASSTLGWTLHSRCVHGHGKPRSGGGASGLNSGCGHGCGRRYRRRRTRKIRRFDGARLTIDYLRSLDFPGQRPGHRADAGARRYLRVTSASYQSEGFKIFGLLAVPGGAPADGWPAIIFNYGYIPPEVYRTTERYVAYQDGFARNGYVTFKSDYRGHGFSEGDARSAYGTPDYVIDVLNATASIKQLPYVDARTGSACGATPWAATSPCAPCWPTPTSRSA
ncbi:MAG: hypothetical protein R2851_00495 [Caldilineaceae bacterium]